MGRVSIEFGTYSMLKGLHNLEKKAAETLRRASHHLSHSEVDGVSEDMAEKVL